MRRAASIRLIVSLAVVAGLGVASTAQAAQTVWTLRPVQRDPLLWIGVAGSPPSAVLTVPAAATATAQQWVFTRSGGTVQYPVYRISNYASRQCLEGPGGDVTTPGPHVPVSVSQCYVISFYNFQFKTLTNQVGNPGLSANRVWRIHHRTRNGYDLCLVVPYSRFVAGTRLGLQRCSQSLNHQWYLTRGTLP